mmetsp:Transcript_10794/g.49737  ORF Transcript_10794/g.49737 Transcript_10794/m.49737 type:complete len:237 (+) Transcript_10794:453-1163(+)
MTRATMTATVTMWEAARMHRGTSPAAIRSRPRRTKKTKKTRERAAATTSPPRSHGRATMPTTATSPRRKAWTQKRTPNSRGSSNSGSCSTKSARRTEGTSTNSAPRLGNAPGPARPKPPRQVAAAESKQVETPNNTRLPNNTLDVLDLSYQSPHSPSDPREQNLLLIRSFPSLFLLRRAQRRGPASASIVGAAPFGPAPGAVVLSRLHLLRGSRGVAYPRNVRLERGHRLPVLAPE